MIQNNQRVKFEKGVKSELREVLKEKRETSHQLSKDNSDFTQFDCIVYAERVNYSRKKHVLSHEQEEVIRFHIRHSVLKILLESKHFEQHENWEYQICHHEE